MLGVVTLATPHLRSPAHLHSALATVYRRLSAMPPLRVPLLSVAGGTADVQVPSQLALLPRSTALLSTHVDSEQLTGVWAAADHRVCHLFLLVFFYFNCDDPAATFGCLAFVHGKSALLLQAIVWCNQIVTLLAELLLDIPDTAAAAAATAGQPEAAILPQADAVHALVRRRLNLKPLPLHAMLFPDAAGSQDERHRATVKSNSRTEIAQLSCTTELLTVVPQDAVQMNGAQLHISTTTTRHAAQCAF